MAVEIRSLDPADGPQVARWMVEHWGSEIAVAHGTIYRPAELPHIAQWVLARAGTYVTALEPHNCPVWSRAQARESGTLSFLAPGEAREYNFEVGVLANNREIEAMASQVIVP